MNYKKIYAQLIRRAKERDWTKKTAPCYVEMHHIKPKSMGGSNNRKNLVCLTAREHFLAHWMLYKIHKTQSMAWAWSAMSSKSTPLGIRHNSKNFERARKALSKEMTGREVSQETREKLRKTSTGRKHSDKTKNKWSIDRKGTPPKTRKCEHCGGVFVVQNLSHFDNCRVNPKNKDLFFVKYGERESSNRGKAIKQILKGCLFYKDVVNITGCHNHDFYKARKILKDMGLI